MSRSSKKAPFIEEKLYARVCEMNEKGEKKVLKTWSRASTIYPEFIGHTVAVHDGRKHIPVYVTEDMIGHKFGEFAPTRTFKGHAGFNLEFLPSQYWAKTYIVDGRPDRFPRYAASETVTKPNSEKPKQFKGYKTYDDRGTGRYIDPLPLEQGREFILAPDAPERMITIKSDDADIMLYDGRILAQNGWYVFRSLIPTGKTGKVITWTVRIRCLALSPNPLQN